MNAYLRRIIVGTHIVAAVLAMCIGATKLDYHSFQAPFEDIDHTGTRIASKHFRASGSTEVNKNFIRLTPDRQSKKGALWSRHQLKVPTISAVLQFRISGQGKNFFGDGIGFWITQQSYYVEGSIHGSQEKFTGIGIIFDTFKNTENIAAHRDVTVLVNDGTKTYEMMTEKVEGCNTNVRYHNERADFSVTESSSKAKISIENNSLTIEIDADNGAVYRPCVTIPDLQLPEGWLERSYIGITATTGALADNHDVLSLKTFSSENTLATHETEEEENVEFRLPDDVSIEEKLSILTDAFNGLLSDARKMDHLIEHNNVATQDHIKNIVAKLEKRENSAEDRLDNLEEFVSKEVNLKLNQRLEEVERITKHNVDKKLDTIESALDRKMDHLKSKTDAFSSELAARGSDGSWKIPFLFVLLVVVAGGVGLYMFYEKMRKMHLL